MKKKYFLVILFLVLVMFLSGCVESITSFSIHEDGQADVEFLIVADKIMAGDEVNVFVWCLTNSFPELQNNYEFEKEMREINYFDYLIYTFQSKKTFDINSNKFAEFKREGDKYSFKLEIPPLIEKIDEGNEDDLMFTIKVSLPKEIDMANSQMIEGDSVTWKITKLNLVKGVELKAFTK
jgi:hypothetical protein